MFTKSRMYKYGAYIECGEQKKSLKNADKDASVFTIEDAIKLLTEEVQEKSVLLTLNEEISIRKGKYGPYIFYNPPGTAKPQFFNIKKYKGNYFNDDVNEVLDWIKKTYQIE